MVRCAARKKIGTCDIDGQCVWNGTSCENDNYTTLLQICKSKTGKAALLEYARKMGVSVIGMTIPNLCLLISNQLQTLEDPQRLGQRMLFNNIITGHNAAPIVPEDIAHPAHPPTSRPHKSSSASIERLLTVRLFVLQK